MGNLLLATLVVVIMLGGPLTLYAVVKILNSAWGGLKVKFIKTPGDIPGKPISLLVSWDDESFEFKVARIKLDFVELVAGGRSFSQSFTFEDSEAKRKTFVLVLNLPENDLQIMTDSGVAGQPRALAQSAFTVEVEFVNGEMRRHKFKKSKILKEIAEESEIDSAIEVVADKNPDKWSVQTRVFPWKKPDDVPDEEGPTKAADSHKPAATGPRTPVDFAVTKVWIEPGCIVCDACEAEAPLVFWVTGDTCIVRENAPLDDAAAIKAAAEGCPVDVIKYTKVPKAAAAAPAT